MRKLIRTAWSVAFLAVACNSPPRQSSGPQPPNAQPQVQTFDLQQRCADRAARLWKEQGYDIGTNQPNEMGFYTNHWNKKLNKCFILINRNWTTDSTGRTQVILRDLQDVLEGKIYASISSRAEGPGWRSRTVVSCTINEQGSTGRSQPCQSETEFDTFVDALMSD